MNSEQSRDKTRSLRMEHRRRDAAQLGGMVACHNAKNPAVKCRRRFRLEQWQHPKMAWCPACRRSEEYAAFRTGGIIYAREAL